MVGTKEALVKIDPSLADNELIVPPEEVMARAQVFRGLSEDEERDFTAQFQSIVVG